MRLLTSPGPMKPPSHKWKSWIAKATKIFMKLKWTRTRARTRQRNALLNCRLDHPLQPRKKCPANRSVCLNCQKEITGQGFASPETKEEHGRQRNRENPRSHHHSRSTDRRNRRRSASGRRRDGDRRELSDKFETIKFESITVDVIGPHALPANKVFVTVNVDLHSISSRPAALKAMTQELRETYFL